MSTKIDPLDAIKPRRSRFGRVDVNALMNANGRKIVGRDEIYEIPLDAIVADSPAQTRAPFDPLGDEEDRGFAENINEFGQRRAVQLTEIEPGQYQIVDGHRRVAALRYLGKATVKATLVSGSEFDLTTDAVLANVFRTASPLEKAELVEFLAGQGLTNKQIAKMLGGCSARYVQYLKSILKADDAVQSAFNDNQINVMTACALAQSPREQQPRLTEIVTERRLAEADVRELTKRVKDGADPDEATMMLGLVFPSPETEEETAQERPSRKGKTPAAGQDEDAPVTPPTPQPKVTKAAGAVMTRLMDIFPDFDQPTLQAVATAASKKGATWRSGLAAGLIVVGEQEPFPPTRDAFEGAAEAIDMAVSVEGEKVVELALGAARLRVAIRDALKKRREVDVPEPYRLMFLSLGKLFTDLAG